MGNLKPLKDLEPYWFIERDQPNRRQHVEDLFTETILKLHLNECWCFHVALKEGEVPINACGACKWAREHQNKALREEKAGESSE